MIKARKALAASRETPAVDDRRRRTRQLGTVLPPLDVFWSYRRREVTDTNVVKAARAAIVWRGADAWDVMRIAVRYLRWVRFPSLLIRALIAEGGDTRRRYGRSLVGQVADMVRLAVVSGLAPREYCLGGLARYGGGAEIFRYPSFDAIRAVARIIPTDDPAFRADMIDNKLAFENSCRESGLPVVRTIAVAREAGIETPSGYAMVDPLPERNLIIKPISGEQGRGIEMWRSLGPDQFAKAEAKTLSRSDLAARAMYLASARGCPMLLQERIENHPDLQQIAGSALATTRIVTMFNESGEPEIVDSFYRTSTLPDAAVDNFHAGGLLFHIDIASGVLRPGIRDGPYDPEQTTHHPETGARVAGVLHPGWRKSAELALGLHRLFPQLIMPGWDIGFTRNGPIVVEGNDISGISINRQAYFGGLVGTRSLALLAFHAGRWLERNEPKRSRWRSQIKSA